MPENPSCTLINLPFHEAGHIFFSPFGRFLHVLGGSLLQVIIPAVCLVAFLIRREPFSASIGLWWVGQSFIDMAPYINDARAGQLMLIGGVTGQEAPDFHDWNVLLSMTGLLNYDGVYCASRQIFRSCADPARTVMGRLFAVGSVQKPPQSIEHKDSRLT